MFTVTKSFKFEAAHQLAHHDGKCAELHGHSYELTVVLKSRDLQKPILTKDGYQPNPKENMMIDFGDISSIVKPLLTIFLDHKFLNETLQTDSPTAEFIAKFCFDNLKQRIPFPLLKAVKIKETDSTEVIYDET